MDILYISGSPRKKSNTDFLLRTALSITGGRFLKLADYEIAPCRSCWVCLRTGQCAIKDALSGTIAPMLRASDAIVLGSPVYFNNVSAQLKTFMDRTWFLKGDLKNKIGGAMVVGRRYGSESALTAMQAFFLKHEMIPANRGVCGIAYQTGDIEQDLEAVESAKRLAGRIHELGKMLGHAGEHPKPQAGGNESREGGLDIAG
ncbi:MAG: flavodoxin family protein [Anaerolineales bacterium]|nr:flavodoxin family protein [Anaerolineales bacterium]